MQKFTLLLGFLICGIVFVVEKKKIAQFNAKNKLIGYFLPGLFAFFLYFMYVIDLPSMVDESGDANNIWKTITTYYNNTIEPSYVLYKGMYSIFPYVWLYKLADFLGNEQFFYIKIYYALLFTYITIFGYPKIVQYIFNKKVSIFQKMLFSYIVLLLQATNYAYTQITIDIPNLFWFTLLVHLSIKYTSKCNLSYKRIIIYGIGVGVAAGSCLCFTGQYRFAVIVVVLMLMISAIKNIRNIKLLKSNIIFAVIGIICCLGIQYANSSFDKLFVNELRDQGAWIPSADEWANLILSEEKPYSGMFFGYGISTYDYQLAAINSYEQIDYSQAQSMKDKAILLLRGGLKHPLEFITSCANKFFLGFCLDGRNLNTLFLILSFSLFFICLWSIKEESNVLKNNYVIFIAMLFTAAIPCITHVELRYMMAIQNFVFGIAIMSGKFEDVLVKKITNRKKVLINITQEENVSKSWNAWTTITLIIFLLLCFMHYGMIIACAGVENSVYYLFS